MGVPVGVRANLALALVRGGFDVVHGFEPGLPSISYLALRETDALTVATFVSPDRLAYPPGRAQRDCRRRPTRANSSASSGVAGGSVEAAGAGALVGGA